MTSTLIILGLLAVVALIVYGGYKLLQAQKDQRDLEAVRRFEEEKFLATETTRYLEEKSLEAQRNYYNERPVPPGIPQRPSRVSAAPISRPVPQTHHVPTVYDHNDLLNPLNPLSPISVWQQSHVVEPVHHHNCDPTPCHDNSTSYSSCDSSSYDSGSCDTRSSCSCD
jgi:FtsZ-interacting cell division protein ZipA